MNSSRNILAFALIIGIAASALSANDIDAAAILQRSLAIYGAARNYECSAHLEKEWEIERDFVEGEVTRRIEKYEYYDFQVRYDRTGALDVFWKRIIKQTGTGPTGTGPAGAINTLEGQYVFEEFPPTGFKTKRKHLERSEPQRFETMNHVIDATEFETQQFMPLLRELIDPAFNEDLLANTIELKRLTTFDKRKCYLIQLQGYSNRLIWIDAHTFNVRKIKLTSDQNSLAATIAWLEWKLEQARQRDDPDAERIEKRIEAYKSQPQRETTYTLVFDRQRIDS